MITKEHIKNAINNADVINTTTLPLETAKVIDQYLRASLVDHAAIIYGETSVRKLNRYAAELLKQNNSADEPYTEDESERDALEWVCNSMVQEAIDIFGDVVQLLIDVENWQFINRVEVANRAFEKWIGSYQSKIDMEIKKIQKENA